MLRIPVRKRVECRTRDLHQSLIVKLSRAISRSSGDQADAAGQHHPDLFTDSLGQARSCQGAMHPAIEIYHTADSRMPCCHLAGVASLSLELEATLIG